MTTLRHYRYAVADGAAVHVEAGRALAIFQSMTKGVGAVALLYSPSACQMARVDASGALTSHDGASVDISGVYELRAFHESAELRWQRPSGAPSGRAVVVTERPIAGLTADADKSIEFCEERRYLLWGKSTESKGSNPGWTRLRSARIREVCVPIDKVTEGQRLVLRAVEYFARGAFGNITLLDERLISIETYSTS